VSNARTLPSFGEPTSSARPATTGSYAASKCRRGSFGQAGTGAGNCRDHCKCIWAGSSSGELAERAASHRHVGQSAPWASGTSSPAIAASPNHLQVRLLMTSFLVDTAART